MSNFVEFFRNLTKQPGGTITIPRWVVYFQAILLGVLSVTCFLFGLAAANLSRTESSQPEPKILCEVSGHVVGSSGDEHEAVVLLLPDGKTPSQRFDPATLHPDSYQALENPTIAGLAEIGGAVTRTDPKGRFWISVDAPQSYLLVVVSRETANRNQSKLSRQETAALANYFLPIEALYSGHEVKTHTVHAQGSRFDTGEIDFR